MNNKENSPFTPGNPVPVELFVGRIEKIKEVIRYVKQTSSGKQENVFLTGDRGIGKSSLSSFLCDYVTTKENFLAIHVFLGTVSNLEELVRHIFDQLLKETRKHKWFDNISQLFGRYIRQVGLFDISVSFTPPDKDLKELVRNFPEALANILEKIKDEKKGLFIVLDDINGLAEKVEFANWYKSFVDQVATHYDNFPVFIMLAGLSEKRNILSTLQPSLMRIFRIVEIEKLTDEEVKYFFSSAFKKVNMKVKSDSMNLMVRYSSGLPILMHEIGDATFWLDTDNIINEKDDIGGIIEAAGRIGKKYLEPKFYGAVRSKYYRSIIRKFEKIPVSIHFTKREVEARLNENEKGVFNNFLKKLRDLGIIEPDMERGKGAYRFVNAIYPVYIWMESRISEKKR